MCSWLEPARLAAGMAAVVLGCLLLRAALLARRGRGIGKEAAGGKAVSLTVC
eukprot:COSAG01_NODE_2963_length_6794_cov_3.981321_9_plen_52_part_00